MSLESAIRSVMTESKQEIQEDEYSRLDTIQSKLRKMIDAYRQDKLPKNKVREMEMLQKEVKKLMAKLYYTEEVELDEEVIKEDGHTDVASAKRQCKTAMEDAQAIIGVLNGMNNEDALPTWWTNKLAIAANSMNKLNDYLANPTEQKEEVELDEKKHEYGPDLKGEISQLQKMLKGLERGKKTPGRGFAKMKIKELIADLEKRQAQDDTVIKMRGSLPVRDRKLSMKKDMYPYNEENMENLDNLIEEALQEAEVKYPHMMYDPKTGEGVEAKTPEDHERMAKMGYTHEKPKMDEAEEVEEHTHYKMDNFGNSVSLLDAVNAVLSGKVKRENIPEEILDDDVADFIGAASKAAQAGKKTFKFGDKEYPVTIKKDTAKKVASKMEEKDSEDKKMKDKKDEKMGKKEPIEIDPAIKEDAEKMTDAQMKKREEIVKELKKKEDEFKERYGDKYKDVMYATATKMAMKD